MNLRSTTKGVIKRVVIKQEFVELTGKFEKAAILQQLLYWSTRTRDAAKYLDEEKRNKILCYGSDFEARHGWIYKTADELAIETMLHLSRQTMRRFLVDLVENGWLQQRTNPEYKWDRTLQYRVNMTKIEKDLSTLGYSLEESSINNNTENLGFDKRSARDAKIEPQDVKIEFGMLQSGRAIPEITSDKTIDNIEQNIYSPDIQMNNKIKEKPNKSNTSVKVEGYTEEFQKFWDNYPKKFEKRSAFKMWKSSLEEGVTPEAMIQASKNYCTYCKNNRTEERHVKLPSNFLGKYKPYEEFINIYDEFDEREKILED